MDYLPEEIEFVRFFVENDEDWRVVCGREGKREKHCPAWDSCNDENPDCKQILSKMEKNEDLLEKDVNIIKFWVGDILVHNTCVRNGGAKPCPNREKAICEHLKVCEQLLQKLGGYDLYEYEIYEKEVQKVIVNDIRKSAVDWHTGEVLEYLTEKPHIDGVGEPDIILKGVESDFLYVVELKVVEARREHVGQLASYVGWYKENPLEGYKGVKGILLAPKFSKGAEYALKACDDVFKKRCFDLQVKIIKPVEQAE